MSYIYKLASRLNDDKVMLLIGLNKIQIINLPDNIIGISKTDIIEELLAIYSSAVVLVNLTLEDNFPTTNLEAQACGKPVIAYDTCGSTESTDLGSDVSVINGDLDRVEKIVRLVITGELSFQSDAIRKRAKTLFDKTTQYRQYIGIYNESTHKDIH